MNRPRFSVHGRLTGRKQNFAWLGLLLSLTALVFAGCERRAQVSLHVVYGSEKKAWLEPLIVEYNQSQSRIHVTGTPMGSVDSIRSIVVGIDSPTVWAPASSLHIPMAEAEWRRVHESELVDGAARSLVASPVVIAIWQEMAEALGWPAKSLGWADIAGLAMSEQGWAAHGRPEWGEFKFGHTHPEYSNSGLISLLAIAYAGVGKQHDLTSHDLADPQVRSLMEIIGASVFRYSSSTGFFAERMFHCENGGVDYLSAAVLYEHLVIAQEQQRRKGIGCAAEQSPVVAIYPTEGTFWTDHPYVVLDAPWVTPEQKAAAREFEAYLLAEPQQQSAMELGFRPSKTQLGAIVQGSNDAQSVQPTTMLHAPTMDVIQELLKLWRQS